MLHSFQKTIPTKKKEKVKIKKNIFKNISDFDWVVFTSAAGVRTLKELAAKIKIAPARMPKIAAIRCGERQKSRPPRPLVHRRQLPRAG